MIDEKMLKDRFDKLTEEEIRDLAYKMLYSREMTRLRTQRTRARAKSRREKKELDK